MRNNVERVEYALRIDCAKNGCDPKHGDDGTIIPLGADEGGTTTINGHACVRLSRVIPAWTETKA